MRWILRPARYGSSSRNRMERMPRYHHNSRSERAILANSAGFMKLFIEAERLLRRELFKGSGITGDKIAGTTGIGGAAHCIQPFVDAARGSLGGHLFGAAV